MRALFAAWALGAALFALAQPSDPTAGDAATERRLKSLADELRCLVCQNQTIAESSAPLAADLRNQIRGQIAQGRSDADIRAYMVERYGDFILYRPPFKAATALLWGGPFALLAIGIAVFVRIARRRGATIAPAAPAVNGATHRAEIEALLSGENGKKES
jgi:cytochrome c-type biogenesis protein CcmH